MIILETHIVPEGIDGIRFSDYGQSAFSGFPSRKSFVKAIKRGEFLINGETATTARFIKTGQTIQHVDLEKNLRKIFPLKLDVVYEDEYLAVVNKPAGYEVSGNKYRTIVNALPHNLEKSLQPDALRHPMPVHRLDYLTSGLLIASKTRTILSRLGEMLAKREIQKRYRAVVIGKIKPEGRLLTPVNGKKSAARYNTVKTVNSLRSINLSLIDLWLETGRTHQLRIQLADAGYPILGDKMYGKEDLILKGKGLFLSAVELCFCHPITGEDLHIEIEQPAKFDRFMKGEEKRWRLYHEAN